MKKNLALVWRRIPQRYRLIGSMCETCKEKFFPVRHFCPKCRRKGKIIEYQFSGKGTIYSYTKVNVAPEGYELYSPYYLAIVKLEEGPLILAQIVDCEDNEIHMGAKVRKAFRILNKDGKEGLINYGFKFVLDN